MAIIEQMVFLFALSILVAVGVFIGIIAASPTEPTFYRGERLSPHAVLYRIRELGKSCAATERGRGIAFERVLRRLEDFFKRVENKSESRELLETALLDAKCDMAAAAEKCRAELSLSSKLGHVNGVPRVFAFCDVLVGALYGSMDLELVNRAEQCFCESAALDESERKLIPTMLLFCLCALFLRVGERAEICEAEYLRGVNDGKAGAAALDMLASVDYVCGLADGFCDDAAAAKLLADNGITISDALTERRERFAQTAQTLFSVRAAVCEIVGIKRLPACPPRAAAFFGGETTRRKNTLTTRGVNVTADNRGSIIVCSAEISLRINVNGEIIELCDFDGVFQSHKTVYRTFTDSVEMSVQIMAPPSEGCCLLCLTVINRTPETLYVQAESVCGRYVADDFDENNVSVCEFGIFDNCEVGLGSDAPCEYAYSSVGKNKLELRATRRFDIIGFGVERVMFAVAAGKRINAACLSRFADKLYFSRAEAGARAYYAEKYAKPDVVTPPGSAFALYRAPSDFYPEAERECPDEYVCGRFTEYGFFAETVNAESKSLSGCMFDGDLYSEFAVGGRGTTFTADGEYNFADVILEERGVVWSPSGELAGDGAACALCRGYVEYTSVRNGCSAMLTLTLSAERHAEIMLLELKNATGDDRSISVMLTAPSRGVRTVLRDDGVYAYGKHGFALFSSEPTVDYCAYREGYLDHGKIARANDFLRGGETPAPTLSVIVRLPPHDIKTVAFCRDFSADGCAPCGITVDDARRAIAAAREKFSAYGCVALQSSDSALAVAHSAALYAARGGLYKYMRRARYDSALLTCFAVKYADVEAVIDTIFKLCEMQESCGRLDAGRKTSAATLLLPLVVLDTIKFCGDCRMLSERVAFKNIGGAVKPATVLEHCFRAIDFSVLVSSSADKKNDGAFCALLLRAVRAFSEYTANPDRVKLYASIAARLSREREARRAKIAAAEIEFDALGAATAYARYDGEDDEYAYAAIKELVDKALCIGSGAPRLFSDSDGVAAALLYTAVTEKFLGISVCGGRAKISPRTALGTPHIEFDIGRGENASHVLIDDAAGQGSWQINIDRISIASDTVSLDGGGNIVMRRSGDAV